MKKLVHAIKQSLTKEVLGLGALCAVSCLVILAVGCSTFGRNPGPPNAAERALFDTITNYVPVTNIVTHIIPVLVTNEVTGTHTNQVPGQPPQIVTLTNYVTVVTQQTNQTAEVTNAPAYTLTPKASTQSGIQTVGSAVNTFFPGIGGIVGYGLAALVGAWGYLRSSKLVNTSQTLAQETETILEFVNALPNGGTYVNALKTWLEAHQNETGAATQVMSILANYVNNPDAKVAAQQVINEINALNATPATPAASPIPPVKLA